MRWTGPVRAGKPKHISIRTFQVAPCLRIKAQSNRTPALQKVSDAHDAIAARSGWRGVGEADLRMLEVQLHRNPGRALSFAFGCGTSSCRQYLAADLGEQWAPSLGRGPAMTLGS